MLYILLGFLNFIRLLKQTCLGQVSIALQTFWVFSAIFSLLGDLFGNNGLFYKNNVSHEVELPITFLL